MCLRISAGKIKYGLTVAPSNSGKDKSADVKYKGCIKWKKIKVQNSKYGLLLPEIKKICDCIHMYA